MAGAKRLFLHAMVVPNAGPEVAPLALMKDAIDRYPIAARKCYTQWGPNGRGFELDSPSVSLSMKTCLMNCSAEKQATGSSAPQDPCGKLARIRSQYWPAELRQAPAGSTMWVWTSKMNSSPAIASAAAAVSNAPSSGTLKWPPVLPSAANASFNVSKVVAAPHSDCRKARRSSPTRRACAPIRRSASALARATGSASGTGRNSPLEVASTLTGSGTPQVVGHGSCLRVADVKLSRVLSGAPIILRALPGQRTLPHHVNIPPVSSKRLAPHLPLSWLDESRFFGN